MVKNSCYKFLYPYRGQDHHHNQISCC